MNLALNQRADVTHLCARRFSTAAAGLIYRSSLPLTVAALIFQAWVRLAGSVSACLAAGLFLVISVPWFVWLGSRLSAMLLAWLLIWTGVEWLLLEGDLGACAATLVLMVLIHSRIWKPGSGTKASCLWHLFLFLALAFSILPPRVQLFLRPEEILQQSFLLSYFSSIAPLSWAACIYAGYLLGRQLQFQKYPAYLLPVLVAAWIGAVPFVLELHRLQYYYSPGGIRADFLGALFLIMCLAALFLVKMLALKVARPKALVVMALALLVSAFYLCRPLTLPAENSYLVSRLSWINVIAGISKREIGAIEAQAMVSVPFSVSRYVSGLLSLAIGAGPVVLVCFLCLCAALARAQKGKLSAGVGAASTIFVLVHSFIAPGIANPMPASLLAAILGMSGEPRQYPLVVQDKERGLKAVLASLLVAAVAFCSAEVVLSAAKVLSGPRLDIPVRELRVSEDFVTGLLSTEDIVFLRHHGFDASQILLSVETNVRNRSYVRGASTITMQLAKLLYLTGEKTLTRKLAQLLIALVLEGRLSKLEILRQYLEALDFGYGNRGIEQASRYYFFKEPSQLSRSEAMRLIFTIQNPTRYNPRLSLGTLDKVSLQRFSRLERRAWRLSRILARDLERESALHPESLLIVTPAQMSQSSQ